MIVVSDTTAITSLIQIGRAELLSQIYGEVFIPKQVERELLAGHNQLPSFIRVKSIFSQTDYQRLLAAVDEGEAEAIVLAKEMKADELLIDEADGRRAAMAEGLQIIGLMGVLLEAKKRGLIASVREIANELETGATFHVSDAVKNIIFKAAGE